MEQVDFFTKDGERVMPNPDEHFVLVGADVIRGNLDVITYTIPAAVSGKIFIGIQYGLRVDMPANVNAITSTSMEMPEPHLIVGWFFRLPKGIWPLRLVFADGTIVNLSKN